MNAQSFPEDIPFKMEDHRAAHGLTLKEAGSIGAVVFCIVKPQGIKIAFHHAVMKNCGDSEDSRASVASAFALERTESVFLLRAILPSAHEKKDRPKTTGEVKIMPMPKRKPNYNGSRTMQELLDAVCDFYGDPVDDRLQDDPDHFSLHDVADKFDITVMKARKLLITGGLYSTSLSRKVQELHAQGLTVAQITEETGLKRASINSYLPYSHIIYRLPDISIKAERQKQYRVRKRNSARTDAEKEEKLWQELIYLQGCLFTTGEGLDFTYKILGEEMFVDQKEKSITRATVMKAYGKVVELEGEVKGPKTLGTFGASYLYPIFLKMGLIRSVGV